MKVVLYSSGAPHQTQAAEWMAAGLQRHGIETCIANDQVPQHADLVVMWGYRQRHLIKAAQEHSVPVLAMDRGWLLPDSNPDGTPKWVGCGFNGTGYQGTFPSVTDHGARWEKFFSHLLQPWRSSGVYALVCGQPATFDANRHHGPETHEWAQMVIDKLRMQGYNVCFRPHPSSVLLGDHWLPERAQISKHRDIMEALADANLTVVFNSASCVEAVLAGVPTVTYDSRSMAWPITTHDVSERPITPDRVGWCHDMAWKQWQIAEIQQGITWDVLKDCVGFTGSSIEKSRKREAV